MQQTNNVCTEVEINPITGRHSFKRAKKDDKLAQKGVEQEDKGSRVQIIPPVNKELLEQFDQVDCEFEDIDLNPDNVILGVDDGQDKEFNSEEENEIMSDAEQSEDQTSDGEISDNNSEGDDREVGSIQEEETNLGVVAFKQKANPSEQFEFLRGTPAFDDYIKKVVASEIRAEMKCGQQPSNSRKKVKPKHNRKELAGDANGRQSPNRTGKKKLGSRNNNLVKSPSETTIYSPAFRKLCSQGMENLSKNSPIRQLMLDDEENITQNELEVDLTTQGQSEPIDNEQNANEEKVNDITNQIVQFIKGIRMRGEEATEPSTSDRRGQKKKDRFEIEMEQAKATTDQTVLAAEQFKAVVNSPPGKQTVITNNNSLPDQMSCSLDLDDQFSTSLVISMRELGTKYKRGNLWT